MTKVLTFVNCQQNQGQGASTRSRAHTHSHTHNGPYNDLLRTIPQPIQMLTSPPPTHLVYSTTPKIKREREREWRGRGGGGRGESEILPTTAELAGDLWYDLSMALDDESPHFLLHLDVHTCILSHEHPDNVTDHDTVNDFKTTARVAPLPKPPKPSVQSRSPRRIVSPPVTGSQCDTLQHTATQLQHTPTLCGSLLSALPGSYCNALHHTSTLPRWRATTHQDTCMYM